jgi:hypothetical protein
MNAVTRKSRFLIAVVVLAILSFGPLAYAQDDGCPTGVPQWVLDRQEYETTFVYVPRVDDLQAAERVLNIPQWALDRQQYEITYVYVPMANDVQAAARVLSIPQWALDRQEYETTYAYAPRVDMVKVAEIRC